MLPRAVVLQAAAAPLRHRALQLVGLDLRPPEHLEGLAGMGGRAGMGGAGDRQPAFAAATALRRTAAHEGGGLEGLEGRAHEAELLRVSRAQQHPAALVAHHGMHAVAGFHDAVAQQPHLQRRHTGAAGAREA